MRNLKLYTLLIASFFMLTLVSCDKDTEDDVSPYVSPNVTLLTAGEWTGRSVFQNGEDQTTVFEESNQFDLSNYTAVFKRDGTYAERYENNTIADGVWEFENNERGIVLNKGTDDEYNVVISKLDEDEFFYIQSGNEFRLAR
ncbi:hypothetical protein DXT99_22945 [Pontibacter diazotrophicus]|uniref:Lipocalin-like domain-containing protein n=1 Tax=Pontibacter diazotrophicus TaxID=1400979 RepID=A0A3D8L3J1_9BACT|nr:hypothetical protein [Pontibacter diazotrophicus]RDV11991.1 hypothetical protein DXT99_22945 [Pontibacter diazotrophicus]